MRVLAVTNMYPSEHAPDSGAFVERQVTSLRDVGCDVDVLFVDRRRDGRAVYRSLAAACRRRFDEVRPDVVHVMYGGVMADVVTRAVGGAPVVISFLGDDLLGNSDFQLLDRLSARYGVLASRRAARRAAGIIVLSENLRRALPQSASLPPVWIVPHGVDLDRFKPLNRRESQRALGWSPDTFHVLFPADRRRPEKRFWLARETVDVLERQGMDVELHELSGLAHAEVPLHLNGADVVLVTSSHEGSPNAFKEALACDAPVVSVDVGDVRKWVEGIEGTAISEAVPDELARALSRVAATPGLRSNGRLRMAEISLDRIAHRIESIYAVVIADFERNASHARRTPSMSPTPGS